MKGPALSLVGLKDSLWLEALPSARMNAPTEEASREAWTGVETSARRAIDSNSVLKEARNWLVAGLGSKRKTLGLRYWLRLRMHHD